jgi:hypothetical protein
LGKRVQKEFGNINISIAVMHIPPLYLEKYESKG